MESDTCITRYTDFEKVTKKRTGHSRAAGPATSCTQPSPVCVYEWVGGWEEVVVVVVVMMEVAVIVVVGWKGDR